MCVWSFVNSRNNFRAQITINHLGNLKINSASALVQFPSTTTRNPSWIADTVSLWDFIISSPKVVMIWSPFPPLFRISPQILWGLLLGRHWLFLGGSTHFILKSRGIRPKTPPPCRFHNSSSIFPTFIFLTILSFWSLFAHCSEFFDLDSVASNSPIITFGPFLCQPFAVKFPLL